MPMPGVAGTGLDGVTRAYLPCDFFAGAGFCIATAGVSFGAGATVALVIGATATVRCVTDAPRSTQRSGSSGQPVPANTDPADDALAMTIAQTRYGRGSFTNDLREVFPVLERLRLYILQPAFHWLFVLGAGPTGTFDGSRTRRDGSVSPSVPGMSRSGPIPDGTGRLVR